MLFSFAIIDRFYHNIQLIGTPFVYNDVYVCDAKVTLN